MSWNEEEYDAMMQESGQFEDEVFVVNPSTFKRVSFAELSISDNEEAFNGIKELIDNKTKFNLEYGIEGGSPYYKIPNRQKLYLNKEIINYIYNWLLYGKTDTSIPTSYEADKNADDNYTKHLLRFDNSKHALTYHTKSEHFTARYYYGDIDYGVLPYNGLVALSNALKNI